MHISITQTYIILIEMGAIYYITKIDEQTHWQCLRNLHRAIWRSYVIMKFI